MQPVVRNREHLSGFTESEQTNAIPHLGTPTLMLSALWRRAMPILELAQALARLARGLAIRLIITEATDELAHFFLASTDGGLQPLPPLFLPFSGMTLLGLPTLKQLFVQQFGSRQQGSGIFRGRLLALPLFLQAPDHRVGLPLSTG